MALCFLTRRSRRSGVGSGAGGSGSCTSVTCSSVSFSFSSISSWMGEFCCSTITSSSSSCWGGGDEGEWVWGVASWEEGSCSSCGEWSSSSSSSSLVVSSLRAMEMRGIGRLSFSPCNVDGERDDASVEGKEIGLVKLLMLFVKLFLSNSPNTSPTGSSCSGGLGSSGLYCSIV